MTVPTSVAMLSHEVAVEHAIRRGFGPPRPTEERVGIEIELLAVGPDGRRADHATVVGALAPLGALPSGTTITFEPGGQLELSTPAEPGVDAACAVLGADLAKVARALGRESIALVASGLDPADGVRRVIDSPRYEAMAAYLDPQGPAGHTMMCATAGLQLNLDLEVDPWFPARRWRLSHLLGPMLAASFANSPLAAGRPSGWKSTRLATWWRLDGSRSQSVGGTGAGAGVATAGAGRSAWGASVMDARVMLIRTSGEFVPVHEPLTFADWVRHGHALGWPTLDDLDYHLTTLFPPVRPRGWLELRMVDTLPAPWWRVPVAVATALLYDPSAAEAAGWAVLGAQGSADLWVDASRLGLDHPALAASARACFGIALDAMPRVGVGRATIDTVAAYVDRYVDRGRCPADDVLDNWNRTGACYLPGRLSSPVPPATAVWP
jgi:glutamate--cysteine ligase